MLDINLLRKDLPSVIERLWIVILPLYLVTTYAIILVLRSFERRFKVA
jgi:hypothetical protein